MFLDYWKLREQPFGVTPDPRFLYFSPGHREALASLFYAIESGRGFSSLIAEPGLGKTTLLFQLLRRWRGYVHSAFLFQTQCDSRELIRYLLQDLGLKSDDDDIVRMHSDLNEFLVRETKAGRRVVIFIDEAQNLPDSVLETVRLLTNFEAADKKLLQIVLAGQPELAQRLSGSRLTQLRQRIAIQARLDPLPSAEVARYVSHRLRVAGHSGGELFTPGALGLVGELSRGVPRLINALCFNALSLGCAMKREQVNSDLVRGAASDLSFECKTPRAPIIQAKRKEPPTTRQPNPSWRSLRGWFRETVNGRRASQACLLAIVLGFAALYLGRHTRRVAAQVAVSNRTSHAPALAIPALGSQIATQPPLPTPASKEQEPEGLAATDGPSKVFAYVVQPHDTISDLCVAMLGRYDANVLQEIRTLNPGLKDLDHLEAGQKIRLPQSSTTEAYKRTD